MLAPLCKWFELRKYDNNEALLILGLCSITSLGLVTITTIELLLTKKEILERTVRVEQISI